MSTIFTAFGSSPHAVFGSDSLYEGTSELPAHRRKTARLTKQLSLETHPTRICAQSKQAPNDIFVQDDECLRVSPSFTSSAWQCSPGCIATHELK